jgi:hypothetical protein
MVRYSLEHLRFLEEHIQELDTQIVANIEYAAIAAAAHGARGERKQRGQ